MERSEISGWISGYPERLVMNRDREIRTLNRLSIDELIGRADGHLLVVDDIDELHQHLADSILGTVKRNNEKGKRTVLILPYGPTGQYPILCDAINRYEISLANSVIFFMDEYADASGQAVSLSHPLSFRGQINWLWEKISPKLRPDPENIVFPSESNADLLEEMIERIGPIEVCYGGIGVHGHVAFNEPAVGIRETTVRLVELNDYTVTINSIRSQVGGDLENFPRTAWTLGMRQCLGAQKVRLYCRNDVPQLDWANTVLRLALLGEPGDDYPVTWIREHPDWKIITDRNTAAPPKYVLPSLG